MTNSDCQLLFFILTALWTVFFIAREHKRHLKFEQEREQRRREIKANCGVPGRRVPGEQPN